MLSLTYRGLDGIEIANRIRNVQQQHTGLLDIERTMLTYLRRC